MGLQQTCPITPCMSIIPLPVAGCRLAVVSCQLPVASRQLPVGSCQWSAAGGPSAEGSRQGTGARGGWSGVDCHLPFAIPHWTLDIDQMSSAAPILLLTQGHAGDRLGAGLAPALRRRFPGRELIGIG